MSKFDLPANLNQNNRFPKPAQMSKFNPRRNIDRFVIDSPTKRTNQNRNKRNYHHSKSPNIRPRASIVSAHLERNLVGFNGSEIEYFYKPRFTNCGYDLEVCRGAYEAAKFNDGRTNGWNTVTAKEIYHVFYTFLSDGMSYRTTEFLDFNFPDATPFQFGENWRKYPSKKRQIRSLLTHFMGHFGWAEGLAYCVEKLGIPINVGSRHGSLISHTAAFYGHSEVLSYVLSHGIDVRAVNQHGEACADAALISWRQFEQQWLDFMRTIHDKENVVLPNQLGVNSEPVQLMSLSSATSVSLWHHSNPDMLHLPSAKGNDFRVIPARKHLDGHTYYRIELASDRLDKPLNQNQSMALTLNRQNQSVSLQPYTKQCEESKEDNNGLKMNLKMNDVNQLWRIEVVSLPEYDFGLSTQRKDGSSTSTVIINNRSDDIKVLGSYVRFVPLSMPQCELYVNRQPLKTTVNAKRFGNRLGELRVRPVSALTSLNMERCVEGLFQMIKESHGTVNHFQKDGNVLKIYNKYRGVMQVIAHFKSVTPKSQKITIPNHQNISKTRKQSRSK